MLLSHSLVRPPTPPPPNPLPPGDASVLRYDVETDTTFLCAHTDYAAGDEVYDSYGPGLAPCDLLMDYGFVDPANGNARWVKRSVQSSSVGAPRSSGR